MAPSKFFCQMEVLPGPERRCETRVDSWMPLRLHIVIGHERLSMLEALLTNKMQHGDVEAVHYVEQQRNHLMIKLLQNAVAVVAKKFHSLRRIIDFVLTALFTMSTLIYLWSIPVGIAIDIALVTAMFIINHMFSKWFSDFSAVACNAIVLTGSTSHNHGR